MPSFRIQGPRFLATTLFAGFVLCSSLNAQDKVSDPSPAQAQSPFKVQVKSNLVEVRVVVRDSKGKPVEGLKKEDFKLFDQGKEQSIAQFDVESAAGPPSSAIVVHTSPSHSSSSVPAPELSGKFVALYFDDLNMSFDDMARGREAVDHYLSANLHSKDRIGIFTSEKMLSDFTNDPQQIHDALKRLIPSVHAQQHMTHRKNCLNLSDYQAEQIAKFPDSSGIDAWEVAMAEAKSEGFGGMGFSAQETAAVPEEILVCARELSSEAEMLASSDLQELDQVVKYSSQMPGQRTVILVSTGFLSHSEQPQLDRIIDNALREQVVVSALDAKGLPVLMDWQDAENENTGGDIPGKVSLGFEQEMAARDVMAELAYGTGGEFFHDNNDLKAGFGALAGSPVYYILAFAPNDVKLDGKFHSLKVTLADRHRGLSLQARRGYFAPKNEADAEAQAKQRDASDAESQTQEQIREALYSKTLLKQFPVTLFAQRTKNIGETRDISFSTHLDTAPLHLRKTDDHNANTVIFALAVFDDKGHLIGTQQRRALIHVPDSQLQAFLKTGMDAEMTFNLKPGPYMVREVVTDTEEHHMGAFSQEVKIP